MLVIMLCVHQLCELSTQLGVFFFSYGQALHKDTGERNYGLTLGIVYAISYPDNTVSLSLKPKLLMLRLIVDLLNSVQQTVLQIHNKWNAYRKFTTSCTSSPYK